MAHSPCASSVGQKISDHLFTAGLDLSFTLVRQDDGPARDRVEHAIAEIDDALRDLRRLMILIAQQLRWPAWLTLPVITRR